MEGCGVGSCVGLCVWAQCVHVYVSSGPCWELSRLSVKEGSPLVPGQLAAKKALS